VAIASSDDIEEANVDPDLLEADLNSTAFEWPVDVVDYFIAFETDNYQTEYKILTRTDKVLTFQSAALLPAFGNLKWVIRGYPKGEVMNLLSYTIGYTVFGDTQDSFSKRSTGEVGAANHGAE
jgi:hypothetical protein